MNIKMFKYVFHAMFALILFTLSCSHNLININQSSAKATQDTSLEEITYYRTDRNDIIPIDSQNLNIVDTNTFTTCQSVIWSYTKRLYKLPNENNESYNLYAFDNGPTGIGEFRDFYSDYVKFFIYELREKYILVDDQCSHSLSPEYFEMTIGLPTCEVVNQVNGDITYFYYIKSRFRKGPCARIETVGSSPDFCHYPDIKYCSFLRVIFPKSKQYAKYIDFAY